MIDVLPNYDNWKTTPPEERDSKVHCSWCGRPLYEGDFAMRYEGEVVCPECLKEEIGFVITECDV